MGGSVIPSEAGAAGRIYQHLSSGRGAVQPVFCLLGPAGSGKSRVLRGVREYAACNGNPVCYVDLSQNDGREPDAFFDWMAREMERCDWRMTRGPGRARLDFVPGLLRFASEPSANRLLILDHVETLLDETAKELVLNLRDFQEQAEMRDQRRLLCVVSGSISMLDMRRHADSPNLQFEHHCLPEWSSTEETGIVEGFFARSGQQVEPEVRDRLVELTRGETTFLKLLAVYLTAPQVTLAAVDEALGKLLRQAADPDYLFWMARLYWIDPEVQRCAEMLISGRTPQLRDAGSVPRDLDRLQLRGPLVAEGRFPHRYRFRNGIVRQLFHGLMEARLELGMSGAPEIDKTLRGLGTRLREWQRTATFADWKDSLDTAWGLLDERPVEIQYRFERAGEAPTGERPWLATPTAQFLLRADNGQRFLVAQATVRGQWVVQAEARLDPAARLTVSTRYRLESWLALFGLAAERGLVLYFAEQGERLLAARHSAREPEQQRSRRVFVVYGRSSAEREAMYEFLRALGLEPIDWLRAKELAKVPAPTIFQVVDAGMRNAKACIVLITGDDLAYLRAGLRAKDDPEYERKPTPQARPNVIFEAGMALGRYPESTILVRFGNVRPFSDVGGFCMIDYKDDRSFRKELRLALETAQCQMDASATGWRRAGKFGAEASARGKAAGAK